MTPRFWLLWMAPTPRNHIFLPFKVHYICSEVSVWCCGWHLDGMVLLHELQHFTGQHYSESIQCRYAMSKHFSLMDKLSSRWCFHPLSKKGRSAVWLVWVKCCGLHILQISTAASAYRRFLIDTLDSSLRCQHQYMQWQNIIWNNQCLGALKLFCYHLVKWHFTYSFFFSLVWFVTSYKK